MQGPADQDGGYQPDEHDDEAGEGCGHRPEDAREVFWREVPATQSVFSFQREHRPLIAAPQRVQEAQHQNAPAQRDQRDAPAGGDQGILPLQIEGKFMRIGRPEQERAGCSQQGAEQKAAQQQPGPEPDCSIRLACQVKLIAFLSSLDHRFSRSCLQPSPLKRNTFLAGYIPISDVRASWRRSSNRAVCKSRSAALGQMVTITLPRFCSRRASCKAAHATAPLLMPTERPSSCEIWMAVVMASWSLTAITRSIRSSLRVSGRKPGPSPSMR